MAKNGLWLMSIGLLIFLYSSNQNSGHFDVLSIITALFFIGLGTFFFVRASRAEKAQKEAEEAKNPYKIKKGGA